MNKSSRKSLFVISSLIILLTGCGPNEIDEPEQADLMSHKESSDTNVPEKEQDEPNVASDACPTGDCESSPASITQQDAYLPDIMKTEPTRVIKTQEREDIIKVHDIFQTTHIWE